MTAGLPHLGQRFTLPRPQSLLGKSRYQPRSRTSNPRREVKLSSTTRQPRGSCQNPYAAAGQGESQKRPCRLPRAHPAKSPQLGAFPFLSNVMRPGHWGNLQSLLQAKAKASKTIYTSPGPNWEGKSLSPSEAAARQAPDPLPALPSRCAPRPKASTAAASHRAPSAAATLNGALQNRAAFGVRLLAGAL